MRAGSTADTVAIIQAQRFAKVVRTPAAFAIAYFAVGWAWLWAGGELASGLAADAAELQAIERVKGGVFMAVTAALLYVWLRWVRRAQERLPKVENKLRDREVQMAHLLEFAPDAILIHDARRILYANPAFFKLLAIPREADLAKLALRDIVKPAHLSTMEARVSRLASQAGTAPPTEISLRTLDGRQVDVEHASSSVRVGGRVLVQSYLRDLTDRNEAWRELQRWNAELDSKVRERTAELSAANQALESFTYSIAHDLRSPVGRMSGFATALIESCERQDFTKVAHYARRVVDNARMMGEMVDGMLLLSRTDRAALDLARIDTAGLVRGCVAQLDEASAKAVQIAELPDCMGDPALLRVVWANLLANALKYSARSTSPRVSLSGAEVDGECRFCVEDNGIGFDPSEAESLFRTFHRLGNARDFAGTGIGLSVVKRIVTRHGGRVWASGRPHEGAKFCFALPSGQAGPAARAA